MRYLFFITALTLMLVATSFTGKTTNVQAQSDPDFTPGNLLANSGFEGISTSNPFPWVLSNRDVSIVSNPVCKGFNAAKLSPNPSNPSVSVRQEFTVPASGRIKVQLTLSGKGTGGFTPQISGEIRTLNNSTVITTFFRSNVGADGYFSPCLILGDTNFPLNVSLNGFAGQRLRLAIRAESPTVATEAIVDSVKVFAN
jgi:hypothetical protein